MEISAMQFRTLYLSGLGLAQIMARTGAEYGALIDKARRASIPLVTGGPHDTATCRHQH